MRRGVWVLGLALLLAGASAAAADGCAPTDLRSTLGAPRDQGDTGWCFSHTTADLISQRTGIRVSAFDVATTFILGNPTQLLQSQDPEVRRYLAENPDFVEKLNNSRGSEPENFERKKILTDEGLYNTGGDEDYAAVMGNIKGLCRESDLPSGTKNFERSLREIRRHHAKTPGKLQCDPARPFGNDFHAITDRGSQIAALSFQDWVDKKCKRVPSPAPLIPVAMRGADDASDWEKLRTSNPAEHEKRRKALAEEIDRALGAGRAVAIGYNAYDIEAAEPGDDKRHGDHSSIIAARKMIGGKCHYFLRNSRGADCSEYTPAFKKKCEKAAGGVWLTLDEIPSLYGVISLK